MPLQREERVALDKQQRRPLHRAHVLKEWTTTYLGRGCVGWLTVGVFVFAARVLLGFLVVCGGGLPRCLFRESVLLLAGA